MIVADHPPEPRHPVPVVLPLAAIVLSAVGVLTSALDCEVFSPPSDADHWTRARFGLLLDALTLERSRSIRLEVYESDEIIRAKRCRDTTDSEPQPEAQTRRARRGTRPPLSRSANQATDCLARSDYEQCQFLVLEKSSIPPSTPSDDVQTLPPNQRQ